METDTKGSEGGRKEGRREGREEGREGGSEDLDHVVETLTGIVSDPAVRVTQTGQDGVDEVAGVAPGLTAQTNGHGCQPYQTALPHVGILTDCEFTAKNLEKLPDLGVVVHRDEVLHHLLNLERRCLPLLVQAVIQSTDAGSAEILHVGEQRSNGKYH